MHTALVGHTGFVGGNLAAQHQFDEFYNSANIEDIVDRKFDLLVVSGMPATMWIANQNPASDRAVLDRLVGCLRRVRSDRTVVMSTVAVYPEPVEVDEDTPIDPSTQTAYGHHRLLLERELEGHFPVVTAVRLPGLFGSGLKKNSIYDMLHNHDVDKLNAAGIYQFYNLDRIWADVSTALAAGVRVVNFATEPVSIKEVAKTCFGMDFSNETGTRPVRFNMRTRHASLFGGRDQYLYNRERILDDIKSFVLRQRTSR